MSCLTQRPRTARSRILGWRTIISTGGLAAAAQLLEVGYELLLVNICQSFGKAVRGSLEFRKIGCFGLFAACGNVNTEGLPAPSDGDGSIRFQEGGDAFPKLADTDFSGTQLGCSCSLRTQMCTH